MQLWLNLFITAQKTLSVLLMTWEKERVQEGSFGWKGDEVARDMGVFNQVSEEPVMLPSGPSCKIEMVRLIAKHSQKNSDIKREIYSGQQM